MRKTAEIYNFFTLFSLQPSFKSSDCAADLKCFLITQEKTEICIGIIEKLLLKSSHKYSFSGSLVYNICMYRDQKDNEI